MAVDSITDKIAASQRRRTYKLAARSRTGYQAVQPHAVVSLILGILSVICFLTVYAVFIPIAGVAFGLVARREILRMPKERLGLGLAKAGVLFSLVFGLSGTGWVMYSFLAAAPPGYRLISFADLQPESGSRSPISQQAEAMEGKKVFLYGHMVAGERAFGITNFVLVADLPHCNFCRGQLKPTQMVEVHLKNGLKLDYSTKRIGVGGVFSAQPDVLNQQFGGMIYRIEADVVR
ncbi:MAG: DUF4190 domain-containing protein [Thermogutta sp.]